MDPTGGDRPREASGEDDCGTGRGLEGEAVLLWLAIEPECIVSPGHICCYVAKEEQDFYSIKSSEFEGYVSLILLG